MDRGPAGAIRTATTFSAFRRVSTRFRRLIQFIALSQSEVALHPFNPKLRVTVEVGAVSNSLYRLVEGDMEILEVFRQVLEVLGDNMVLRLLDL